jgi:DNA-binding IclR family transcriptional regulator
LFVERKIKSTKPGKPKTRLSSVANAIRLVKVFSDDDYEIGISDLGKRLLLPKSAVHRLASTLIDAGMLEQNAENGKYRLGLTLFELGSLVRRKMDFSSEAKPYLMALREKTGETVHLAILGHTSIIYINSLESKHAIRMTLEFRVADALADLGGDAQCLRYRSRKALRASRLHIEAPPLHTEHRITRHSPQHPGCAVVKYVSPPTGKHNHHV